MHKYGDVSGSQRPTNLVKREESEATLLYRSTRDGSLHKSADALKQHHAELDKAGIRMAFAKQEALPIERENALNKLIREEKQ